MEYDGWWVQLVGVVIAGLGTVLTYFLSRFFKWLEKKAEMQENEKEAIQLLLEGMALAQEDIVREAKKSSADGKLTKEEIERAQDIAIDYAKNIATGPVKDVVTSWTKRRASSLIKQLLSKLKGTKNGDNSSPTN